MREKLGNITLRNIIIGYVMMYSIMPIVARLTSRYLTTYFYMISIVILVVLILALDRPENLNEYLVFLLPFILYYVASFFVTPETPIIWGFQMLIDLNYVILGYYFMQETKRISPSYTKMLLIIIILTMITTIFGCIRNPNAARELASAVSSDAKSFSFDMQNIGGYEFVYIMVLLYPLIILAYKTRRIRLFPTIALAALVFATILFTEYTIALLLFAVSSCLFFTKRDLSVRGIVIISISALVFALLFSNVIVDILNWFSRVIDSETVSARLSALSGGKEGMAASDDNRWELYQLSINSFLEHPILGSFVFRKASGGGHSCILDSLSQFGLFGGVLLFYMYRNIFMKFFLPYREKDGFGYVVWVFIQALILSLINTGLWLNVLCLFIPLLLYYIYQKEPLDDVWSQIREAKTAVSKK